LYKTKNKKLDGEAGLAVFRKCGGSIYFPELLLGNGRTRECNTMNWPKMLTAAVTFSSAFVLWQTSAHAAPAGEPLFAVLLGGNEVGPGGRANVGDPNGIGSATVLIRGNTLCYTLAVFGIANPTAAHIHQEAAGLNGPIVINFNPPRTGNPGTSSGCVNVAPALISNIRNTPNGFYVNIHNSAYPGGAVRGQLY
jgi:hypothetical protein